MYCSSFIRSNASDRFSLFCYFLLLVTGSIISRLYRVLFFNRIGGCFRSIVLHFGRDLYFEPVCPPRETRLCSSILIIGRRLDTGLPSSGALAPQGQGEPPGQLLDVPPSCQLSQPLRRYTALVWQQQ